jgi:hypothetical protein
VNDQGQLAAFTETASMLARLRGELATLPADAPLVEWGRWVLNDREDRSIAPGFTITLAEAEELKARLAVGID